MDSEINDNVNPKLSLYNVLTEQLRSKNIDDYYQDINRCLDTEEGINHIKQVPEYEEQIHRWARVPSDRAYDTNFHNQSNWHCSYRHEEFSAWYLSISDCYYNYALFQAAVNGGNLHNDLTVKFYLEGKKEYTIRPLKYLGVVGEERSYYLKMGSRWIHIWRVMDLPSIKIKEISSDVTLQCNLHSLTSWGMDLDDDMNYSVPWNSRYGCLTIGIPFEPCFTIKLSFQRRNRFERLHNKNLMLDSLAYLDLFDFLKKKEFLSFRQAIIETNKEHSQYDLSLFIRKMEIFDLKQNTFHVGTKYNHTTGIGTTYNHTDHQNESLLAYGILKVWIPITMIAQMYVENKNLEFHSRSYSSSSFDTRSKFKPLSASVKLGSGSLHSMKYMSNTSFLKFDYDSYQFQQQEYKNELQRADQPDILNNRSSMLQYACYQSQIPLNDWKTIFEIELEVDDGVKRGWRFSRFDLTDASSIVEKVQCQSNSTGICYPDHVLNRPRPIVEYICHAKSDQVM